MGLRIDLDVEDAERALDRLIAKAKLAAKHRAAGDLAVLPAEQIDAAVGRALQQLIATARSG